MSKSPHKLHKPKRRVKIQHPRQPETDDLRELSEVISEYRLNHNADGWFKLPWRDGWNAAALGLACFDRNHDGHFASTRENNIWTWLSNVVPNHEPHAEDYYQATEFLTRIDLDDVSPYLRASVRCLQVWIANSDGSGTVYNAILAPAFDRVEPIELVSEIVLEYRCRDAIGVTSVMCSDPHNRKRRAFITAWRRGLFHAAYSIEPVK